MKGDIQSGHFRSYGKPWKGDIMRSEYDRIRASAVALWRMKHSERADDELKARRALLIDLAIYRTPDEDYELEAIEQLLRRRETSRKRAEIIARHPPQEAQ